MAPGEKVQRHRLSLPEQEGDDELGKRMVGHLVVGKRIGRSPPCTDSSRSMHSGASQALGPVSLRFPRVQSPEHPA